MRLMEIVRSTKSLKEIDDGEWDEKAIDIPPPLASVLRASFRVLTSIRDNAMPFHADAKSMCPGPYSTHLGAHLPLACIV